MCNHDEKIEFLYTFRLILSSLSAISCILILIFIYKYRKYNGPSTKLLMNMSVIDMIRGISFFLLFILKPCPNFCNIYSILIHSTFTSNSIWSLYIVTVLYKIYTKFPEKPKSPLLIWNIFAYIISPVFQILPIFTDSYGYIDGFCGYKNDFYGYMWRSIQIGMVFFIICIEIYLYSWIFIRFRRYKLFTFKELVFEKGMIYSIIYFFIIIATLAYRYFDLILGFCDAFWLAIISFGLLGLHGFFNFLALICNKNFRMLLRQRSSDNKIRVDSDSFLRGLIEG